ncbi:hypothetical protein [Paludibaculum fermentans]|uniref:hypothetical protein n=1 Tax=Paludibaculum fermentans TaxID=1473598 RepID=UPI003EBC02DE
MRKDLKLSRRSLALILGLPALPLNSAAQQPARADRRQILRQDAEELAKVKLPRDCAPAFRFQP